MLQYTEAQVENGRVYWCGLRNFASTHALLLGTTAGPLVVPATSGLVQVCAISLVGVTPFLSPFLSPFIPLNLPEFTNFVRCYTKLYDHID